MAHVDSRKRGPKELTGMVDLTRDAYGRVRARLLDLVPGRSGRVYADWLNQRGQDFRDGMQLAASDPFAGYKRAIDDELADATGVLDAFHVLALGTKCKGRQRAEALIGTMASCPIPEVARLGRTLRKWRDAFLAYFTTGCSSNGGTEAVNGTIELHRRLARGYRNFDNYRLRCSWSPGGLTP